MKKFSIALVLMFLFSPFPECFAENPGGSGSALIQFVMPPPSQYYCGDVTDPDGDEQLGTYDYVNSTAWDNGPVPTVLWLAKPLMIPVDGQKMRWHLTVVMPDSTYIAYTYNGVVSKVPTGFGGFYYYVLYDWTYHSGSL